MAEQAWPYLIGASTSVLSLFLIQVSSGGVPGIMKLYIVNYERFLVFCKRHAGLRQL